MRNGASQDWLDKTGFGVIGRFTLDDGEELAAEIVSYSEDTEELIVEPIMPGDRHGHQRSTARAIEVDRVLSFVPEPRSSYEWPHSDPCRTEHSSFLRLLALTTLFLGSTAGSLTVFIIFLNGEPYRLQELSALSYSLAVVWLIFAAHRDAPRFLFSCPAVKPRLLTLLGRHIGFLTALFLFQAAALAIRPQLPAWWSTKDSKGATPFQLVLLLVCSALALAEVYTSRALLKRAHMNFRQS